MLLSISSSSCASCDSRVIMRESALRLWHFVPALPSEMGTCCRCENENGNDVTQGIKGGREERGAGTGTSPSYAKPLWTTCHLWFQPMRPLRSQSTVGRNGLNAKRWLKFITNPCAAKIAEYYFIRLEDVKV